MAIFIFILIATLIETPMALVEHLSETGKILLYVGQLSDDPEKM
jgi:hypothetical protein